MGFDASQKSLIRAILAISLPAIVTNITVPLLGVCDIAIAGHKGGAAFIAALAIGASMFNMLYWVFGFLRMGSSGLTAQAFGAGDFAETRRVLVRALTLGCGVGCLMVAAQRPIFKLLIAAMDVDAATTGVALRYFSIVVWGAPAILGTYALTGWFLGMQNTRIPMAVSIVADLVNIAVSLTLVFWADLRIEGVAIGTLSAQWCAFLIGLIVAHRRWGASSFVLSEVFNRRGLAGFFKVNIDIFLRTLCLVAVTLWFTRTGARQGESMLAVNALLMQMFTIFSYFMDGFAFSGEALVGRFKGACDEAKMRATVKTELLVGLTVAVAFTVAYVVLGREFLSLLTDDKSVVDAAADYLPWVMTIPLAGFMAFSFDGVFIGATATRRMLLSMAVAMALFFALYALFFPTLGNHGLWLAFVAYLLARGVVLWLSLPAIYHKD